MRRSVAGVARWMLFGVAALCAAAACGGGSASLEHPVASLASSPAAAAAFDHLLAAWRALPDHPRLSALHDDLERYLERFPGDGRVPLVRVYLALVAMKEGDFATADGELALGERQPPGSTRDFWTVARARRVRLLGKAEEAMDLLRPLVGKNVDPDARATFEEELTLSALATRSDYEAISYMDAWLRATPDEDRARTMATVTGLVEHLPRAVMVGALQAMRSERASFGYGVDIERILAARLVRIATTTDDVALARMLLDPDAGAVVVDSDAGVALGELAASRRGLNGVDGHTIGLLLPTESPALRDESADVLRGVMWALGLPRGVRTTAYGAPPRPSSQPAHGPLDAQARPSCAPLDPAPPLVDPRVEEALHLASRDDAGTADRTEVSLDELAGEGAAIIIAGLDAQTASRALRWGENHEVPVIALVPPDEPVGTPSFGFVAGEPRAAVISALAGSVPTGDGAPVAPVVDASEVASYPAEGGRYDGWMVLGPVSCDIPPARAGDPRFPLAQWAMDRAHSWLVSGSSACARDLIGELSAAKTSGTIALTLEAAAFPTHAPSLRVVTAAAGAIPGASDASANPSADAGELQRFRARLGPVSWWTALGRDAATLARLAVRDLPTDETSDASAVVSRRRRARDLLGRARARLWSTEHTGWTVDHAMKRTVCAVEVSTTGEPTAR